MQLGLRNALASAAALTIAALVSSPASTQEVVLTAVTAAPINIGPFDHFPMFRDKVNQLGKGVVQIRYLGGPEVTTADKQPDAMRRGVFDIVYGPPAHYQGLVPELSAFYTVTNSPQEYRADGKFGLISEIYKRRLGVHVLGTPNLGVGFNFFMLDQPKTKADGMLDLTGVPVRSVSSYRAFINALGGAAIDVPPADVFSALEKRLIQAIAYPGFEYVSQPWFKYIKYRVDPQFMHLVNVTAINMAKWESLSPKARDVLARAAEEHDRETYELMKGRVEKDAKLAAEKGVQAFTLSPEAGTRYRVLAAQGLWQDVERLVPDSAVALKKSFGM